MTNQTLCAMCNNQMNLVVSSGIDGKTWQCGRPCRTRISVRDHTFFSKSHLQRDKILMEESKADAKFRKDIAGAMKQSNETFVP